MIRRGKFITCLHNIASFIFTDKIPNPNPVNKICDVFFIFHALAIKNHKFVALALKNMNDFEKNSDNRTPSCINMKCSLLIKCRESR